MACVDNETALGGSAGFAAAGMTPSFLTWWDDKIEDAGGGAGMMAVAAEVAAMAELLDKPAPSSDLLVASRLIRFSIHWFISN